tara:strand:+ start:1015 stop:2052 length:1038 start_codon:yes stop_codon:yes gene_type:complete
MKAWMCITTLLLLTLIPATSLAQTEPQPEVDITCTVSGDMSNDPYDDSSGRAQVACELQNDDVYEVEVETDVEWVYTHDHDTSSTIRVGANSEEQVYFLVTPSETAQAGMETLTFKATVVQYGNVRECTNCETTTDTVDIFLRQWTYVDLEIQSQSPEGTFDIPMYEDSFQPCEQDGDYSLQTKIAVDGNHDFESAIGFERQFYSYSGIDYSDFAVEVPQKITLDIEPGQSTSVDASFSLTVRENQTEDVYVIFAVFAGELEHVNGYLAEGDDYLDDYYTAIDFVFGGCVVVGLDTENGQRQSSDPIIIDASSDDSYIYLIAGIAGATTVCLLVVLIVVLVRKSD